MDKLLHNLNSKLSSLIAQTDKTNKENIRRAKMYLQWLANKTDLINAEHSKLKIPDQVIPQKITSFRYKKIPIKYVELISKYYKINKAGEYELSVLPTNIKSDEKVGIVKTLLLSRGNVCWADLGFNVGCEFGGRHPVLIIQNWETTLLVIPLTSQVPKEESDYKIEIPKVYNFADKQRWANITCVTVISIYRIDFNGSFGSVKGEVLDKIRDKFKENL